MAKSNRDQGIISSCMRLIIPPSFTSYGHACSGEEIWKLKEEEDSMELDGVVEDDEISSTTIESETDIAIFNDSPKKDSNNDGRNPNQFNHPFMKHLNITPDILSQIPSFCPIGSRKRLQSVIEMICLEQNDRNAFDESDEEFSLDDLEYMSEKKMWTRFSDKTAVEQATKLVELKDPSETFKEEPLDAEVELEDLKYDFDTGNTEVDDVDDVLLIKFFESTYQQNAAHSVKKEVKLSPMSPNTLERISFKDALNRVTSIMSSKPNEKHMTVLTDTNEKLYYDDLQHIPVLTNIKSKEKENILPLPPQTQSESVAGNDLINKEDVNCKNTNVSFSLLNVHRPRSHISDFSSILPPSDVPFNLNLDDDLLQNFERDKKENKFVEPIRFTSSSMSMARKFTYARQIQFSQKSKAQLQTSMLNPIKPQFS